MIGNKFEKFRRGPWLWVALGVILLPVVMVSIMLVLNSVDTSVNDADRLVIVALEVDEHCQDIAGFEGERRCIEAIQARVFEDFPDTECAFVKGESRHDAQSYTERGYGCCYDRAKLIEQALRHYGFEVRRVAIYKRQSNPLRYMVPDIRSHALSEVMTERGWLAVDSIEPLVALGSDGEVYSVGDIREGMEQGTVDDNSFAIAIPNDFFEGDFVWVYGLYSRHGYFFEPHLPVPELDWSSFGF